jgi:hypothetical protein
MSEFTFELHDGQMNSAINSARGMDRVQDEPAVFEKLTLKSIDARAVLVPVCTENSILVDYVTESPNVGYSACDASGDARAQAWPGRTRLPKPFVTAPKARRFAKVTWHWFGHSWRGCCFARAAQVMEQGGWLDIRSVIGYSHDVQEYRRQMVGDMDETAVPQTR